MGTLEGEGIPVEQAYTACRGHKLLQISAGLRACWSVELPLKGPDDGLQQPHPKLEARLSLKPSCKHMAATRACQGHATAAGRMADFGHT